MENKCIVLVISLLAATIVYEGELPVVVEGDSRLLSLAYTDLKGIVIITFIPSLEFYLVFMKKKKLSLDSFQFQQQQMFQE